MKGLELLLHSIRQVTGNLDGAIRVSALPYAIQVVAGLLLGAGLVGAGADTAMPSGGAMVGLGLSGLLFMVAVLVTSLWTAVAWHRFILLNEAPHGFVPSFHKDRILAYFLRALAYGLLVLLIGMVLGMIIGFILSPVANSGNVGLFMFLIALLVQLPLVILSFRLMAGLPGTALGEGTDIMAGWQATKGATFDIAVLAVFVVVVHLLIGLIDYYVLSGVWALTFLWNVVVGWLLTMVGVSILTTLYGHYVQKRPLV